MKEEKYGITQDFLRERYDYDPEGYLIARYNLAPNCLKGTRAGRNIHKSGYHRTFIKGQEYPVHRLVYIWHYGYPQHEIDHIDNDKLNNRIENLRDVTHGDNMRNTVVHRRNGGQRYYRDENGKQKRTQLGKWERRRYDKERQRRP